MLGLAARFRVQSSFPLGPPSLNLHPLRKERQVFMRRLTVFNFVSMNGYFKGANEDISWAHSRPENDYGAEMLKAGDVLLFGRKTYEVMVQLWPTPEAMKSAPEIAEGMNKAEKIVFSRTLDQAAWNNTHVM